MIGIPFEFAPSSLLQYEQIPSVVKTLLENSRISRRDYKWEQAERYALDAQNACTHTGSPVSLAAAQLHLADVYRQVGELGKAMGLCENAYRIFNGQPAGIQRHNEAVAAYAQGLLHTLRPFSNDIQTLHWYRKALTLFREVQELWAKQRDQSHFDICQNVLNHIEKQVVDIHTSGQARPGTLDVLHLDSVKMLFDRNLQGYVLDDSHVEIAETTYRLHSGTLSSSDVDDAHYCFALPVRGQLKAFPAAQDDDYVIVRLHWWLDKERIQELDNARMPGVVWFPDDGWDVGDFTVTPSGRIWFYPNAMKARFVGDEDAQSAGREGKDPTGAIKGHIIGLLKPDTSPLPKENDETEGVSVPQDTDSDKEDEKDSQTRPPTQIQVLDPVWLFSDDLDVLDRLLEPSGKIEISTDKAALDEYTQVLENLPVGQLDLSVPEIGMSITIRPRQVDVRWPHDWDTFPEADVVNEVQKFVASRRHPLYIFAKKGWQLVTMSIAFVLLLPMVLFDFLSEGSNIISHIMGILGILIGVTFLALAFAGRNMPSDSRVTLWKWTREKFSQRVKKIAYYMAGVGSFFSLGVLVGSRSQTGGWGWLTLLGLVAAVSTATWIFGLSVQRVEH